MVKSFFVFCLLAMSSLFLLLLVYSYEELTSELLNFYGKQEQIDKFRTHYFTPGSYFYLKILLLFFSVLLLFSLYRLTGIATFIARKVASIVTSLKAFWLSVKETYVALTIHQKVLFYSTVILIGGIKLYFLRYFPFHVDELSSYLFFVKKGFFVTISYYPSPNNHIFYSLMAYLSQPFFSNPYYVMKVPSLLWSMLTSGFLFLFLLRYFPFSRAVLGTIIFSFACNYFVYSISGRGYALMTTFTILSAFMVLEIISGRDEKFKWHIYALSSILGFYTMVIYLYPFVSLIVAFAFSMVFAKKYFLLKPFIYYHLIIIMGVLILYTPVFLISGLSSITSNSWMVHYTREEFVWILPKIIKEAFIFMLNIDKGTFLIGSSIIFITIFILIKEKRKEWVFLLTSFFLVPPLLLMIQCLYPYGRVWTYLIFPMSLCIVIMLDFIFSRMIKSRHLVNILFLGFSSMITGYTIYYFHSFTNQSTGIYEEVDRIASSIVSDESSTVYTNDDTYNIYLRYYGLLMGKRIVPEMGIHPSVSDFDYVLITPSSSFPDSMVKDNYIVKEKNEYIEVYALKENRNQLN